MKRDIDLIRLAAAHLDNEADCLRQSHNADYDHPDWKDETAAKASHDSLLRCSEDLLALANRMPQWRLVVDSRPDSDTTVLIFDPTSDEPVWLGYLDGDIWRTVDAMPAYPTHWADMLEGPAS